MLREESLPTRHRTERDENRTRIRLPIRPSIGLGVALAIASALAASSASATGAAAATPLSGGALSASASMLAAISPTLRHDAPAADAAPPGLLAALAEPHERVVEGRIETRETLGKALARLGLAPSIASLIQRQLKPKFDFRRTRPGHQFRVTLDPRGALAAFHYRVSKTEHYWLERKGKAWRAWREESDVRREKRKIAGVVSSSLTDAIAESGNDTSRLAQDFAGIFAWDLDFSRGVQPGDEFRILYEHAYAPQSKGRERSLGPGRILAAKYHGAGGELSAIYYETEPGSGGYYRTDGTSVQGEFLAAPLNFSRITSSFSPARFHPILRRTRPHPGVDYAAPTGTPVWSVANGVVSYSGWMSGYGRLVKIRHSDGYETYYAHLSRFANGLRVGQTVRQKQVIGFVGSSGLSTGPHVCFRITRNGQWVDPLRARIANKADKIPKSHWTAFQAVRDRHLDELGPAPIVSTHSAM
jgi:murein DD-endopeptidase MepM/ murein hydrolase activator NlpD